MTDFILIKKRRRVKRPLPYSAVYLTFKDDPRNNMVVTYHQSDSLDNRDVFYRKRGTQDEFSTATPVSVNFQGEDKTIHHANLSGLDADSDYEFNIGDPSEGRRLHYFRTMPNDLSEPVKCLFGSDVHVYTETRAQRTTELIKAGMSYDPRFIVIGGDWVDDDGMLSRSGRWIDFFNWMSPSLIGPQNRIIPIVPAIGNHDIRHGDGELMSRLFFEDMFAFPDEGQNNYGVVDIGDYLSLIILDTVSGGTDGGNPNWNRPPLQTQIDWADSVMSARSGQTHIVPVYHFPMLSAHRDGADEQEQWIDKFVANGVKLAFSGHEHVWKVSEKVKYDAGDDELKLAGVEESGLIEYGDGVMNQGFRAGDNLNEWYINRGDTDFFQLNVVTFELDKVTIDSIKLLTDQKYYQHEIHDTDEVST